MVLTGPPGPGKSSVLMALADALSDDDVAHGAVEVEALARTVENDGDLAKLLAGVRLRTCFRHGSRHHVMQQSMQERWRR